MVINLLPSMIKDIERLQKYERIFQWLLKNEIFSKQEICKCGESKYLIGKIINSLLAEGAIKKKRFKSLMGNGEKRSCFERRLSDQG